MILVFVYAMSLNAYILTSKYFLSNCCVFFSSKASLKIADFPVSGICEREKKKRKENGDQLYNNIKTRVKYCLKL